MGHGMHAYRTFHSGARVVPHLINGEWRFEKGSTVGYSPWTGEPTFELAPASRACVDEAIVFAERGGREWARASAKDRARILFQVRDNILQSIPELRATVSFESGKTIAEAEAGLMKGVEVLEFALSLQNLDSGGRMEGTARRSGRHHTFQLSRHGSHVDAAHCPCRWKRFCLEAI
jgi:acyl-CoA reductase-like NAD-dependent aldehyde dehydrogenase